ncbi:uncharacterized protein F4822DRAFT_420372 [Hypoxylon trugodes]|uniref:uncharacterized protein n=1 Tax=Hypoxylon trugodes TaxID=326681 RepID=UPI0021997DF1|nr:uncharacterized protein F4822DRAFT_420372 [Hypoxylon trugodes]KAI1383368.1 hypothetical protein F4822DRAFT_420372 [Hypoxylon trugodes]
MAEQTQPLFGLVPAGQPLITLPSSQPSATSFLYAIPHSIPSPANPTPKPFSHLAVFLLPGITLPDGYAAAIYVALNPAALASGSEPPNFKFLGGVGPGKESAVFKLSPSSSPSTAEGIIIGIGVEEAGSVAERMQQIHSQPSEGTSTALVTTGSGGGGQPSTQVLAQRIIQNAFNFLAGFSGKVGAEGVEVIPLRAFQEWWKKFETKVRNDPTFLERGQD